MKIIPALLICLSVITAHAQKPAKVLQWMNNAKADQKDFYFELPFEYINDHIIIKATVGNQTYNYVFDTGGYNDITDEIQQKNNFPVLTRQTVGSANRLKSVVNIVRVDSLRVGELVFRDIAALQMNFKNLPSMQCGIDGGLIGASIIKNYVWQIDYSRKVIIVTDQVSKIAGINSASKIPVTFNSRLMPFITASLDGKPERFMFDLGSSSLFSLTEKAARNYTGGKVITLINGAAIEGGNGTVQQPIHIFKADSLQISSATFLNKPVIYTALSNENLIGNPIIKNYVVTLDFSNSALYLSPLPGVAIAEGWKSFGFKMEYRNGVVKVAAVYEGLAAAKAGIQPGDEVIAIDGQSADCTELCSCTEWINKMISEKGILILKIRGKATDYIVNREKVY